MKKNGKKFFKMKNNILIVFFILLSIGICKSQSLGIEYASQKNITLRFDHIEVTDMIGNKIVKKVHTMIVYYPSGLTIVTDEEKIYTFLVPGTEFDNLKAISFVDIKMDVRLDTADTINAVIYQSTIRPYQIAHQIGDNGVTIKKKDKSGIRFYEKQ